MLALRRPKLLVTLDITYHGMFHFSASRETNILRHIRPVSLSHAAGYFFEFTELMQLQQTDQHDTHTNCGLNFRLALNKSKSVYKFVDKIRRLNNKSRRLNLSMWIIAKKAQIMANLSTLSRLKKGQKNGIIYVVRNWIEDKHKCFPECSTNFVSPWPLQ